MCPDPFDFAGGGLFPVVPAGLVPRLGITDRAAAGGPGAVGRFARASAPRAHMDAGGGLRRHPDPPAAHFVRRAHRRGALCRGRVVSGHVPQPHGVARSAGRVDRRMLRCGAGDSARRELRRHHGRLVPLRPCGGGTDVSGRAAEPDALESGDGAGGRDGRVAVFRRNLLY